LLLRGPVMTPWAEAALFAAARVEVVERVIRPALERGVHVVCDRFLDSSLAYQGIARGLGVERVLDLNASLVGDVLPERTFVLSIEPEEAMRLLASALPEGPGHAYLFHGPAGVGKWKAALAFAGALLGDAQRAMRMAHPDLYLLEPLGDQIRIDAVRELRRDLHMRPFEAE